MLLLGCKPKGRHTEQHDIFFGIGNSLADLKPAIKTFWPDAGPIHIDAWREVNVVDGFNIRVIPKALAGTGVNSYHLFFLNLGGYRKNEFEEYHYKMLNVATEKASAIKASMQTAFYKHTGFKGATSHIDDKYGVDVDDLYVIDELLTKATKEKYAIEITSSAVDDEDVLHLGYFKF